MARHGNQGKEARSEQVRMLGYINQQLGSKSTHREFPAESAGMHAGYVIYHPDNLYGCGSGIERPHKFWMQMIIHRNDSLVINNNYLIHIVQLLNIQ
jgi:hypothetical protein